MEKNIKLISGKGCKLISKQLEKMFTHSVELYNESVKLIDLVKTDDYEVLKTDEGVALSISLVRAGLSIKGMHSELMTTMEELGKLIGTASEASQEMFLGFRMSYALKKNKKLYTMMKEVESEMNQLLTDIDITVEKLEDFLAHNTVEVEREE